MIALGPMRRRLLAIGTSMGVAVLRIGRSLADVVRHGVRQLPVVRQTNNNDCAAAVLATVLGYHGRHVPLRVLRDMLGPGRSGASAAAVLRVGEQQGLRGRAVRLEIDDLHCLPRGTILHWQFHHYVVLDRVRRDTVKIIDPSVGRRTVDLNTFRQDFTGVALILEPTDGFCQEKNQERHWDLVWSVVKHHRQMIGNLIVCSVVIQGLLAFVPLLTAALVDRVIPHGDRSLWFVLTLTYCALQLFSALVTLVRSYLSIHFRTQLELALTSKFVRHLIDLPYSFFQSRTAGDLMVRMSSNTAVRDVLTSTLLSVLLDGMMAALYLVLLLWVNPTLTAVVLLLAGARVALLLIIRWQQRELLIAHLETQARAQTCQVEMLAGMETLKAVAAESTLADSWSGVFVEGLNVSIQRGRVDALFYGALNVLGMISTLTLTFYGTYLVLGGHWSLGSMLAFSALATGLFSPLNSLISSGTQWQMLETYLERLDEIFETPPEPSGGQICPPLQGGIEIVRVSFGYEKNIPPILSDVTLHVQRGQRVALVGPTACGKSTLARLMAGLYAPNSGQIAFDGHDIRALEPRSLRRQLGIVTQDTYLFGWSIRRNIALAEPNMSFERVVKAATLACIHDEIMAMPFGYDTVLADRGLSLSGGQRQRIALARAVATEPRILVLDEATSHLDAITERAVIGNLSELNCTAVVIAHRLSAIREADTIVVMNSGRIIEEGRHDDLIQLGGSYARLVACQNSWNDSLQRSA